MKNIILCGHICVDIIPCIREHYVSLDSFITKGSLRNVGPMTLNGGGPVFNTGVALLKLMDREKYNILINSNIGEDALGKLLQKIIIEKGFKNFNLNIIKKADTSYTIALSIPGLDRSYLHHTGANDFFCLSNIKFPNDGEPCLMHLGYPPLMRSLYINKGNELIKILKNAKKKDYITSIDMSLVSEGSPALLVNWEKILENILLYVDIFMVGLEEAHLFLNKGDYFKIKKRFEKDKKDILVYYDAKKISNLKEKFYGLGANLIFMRAGKKGGYLFSKSHINRFSKNNDWNNLNLKLPALKISKISNSIGAGDSSAAGFIESYTKGKSPLAALKNSMRVALRNLRSSSGEII